jgi:hypothetical protein
LDKTQRQQLVIEYPQEEAPLISGQQTWIARIPMKSEIAFIWMADLWGSAPDGVKGHDIQYWSPPLKFNATNSSIDPIENVYSGI